MSKKIIYLLCSPGFGLIDSFIPLIHRLKKINDIDVYFVFPEKSSLQVVEKDSQLFEISDLLLEGVIFKNYTDRWMFSSNLYMAKKMSNISDIDKALSRLAVRLIKGKLSIYKILYLFGKIILNIVRIKNRIKISVFYNNSIFVNKLDLFGNVDAILYDITTENKTVNKEFLEYFKSNLKLSVFHGPAARWLQRKSVGSHLLQDRSNTVVYTNSPYENQGYLENFNIKSNNLVNTGIIRHDKEWIDFIINYKENSRIEPVFDKFVFLISRPASPYSPPDRKRKYLEDINNLICGELDRKIVIKPHPKEDIDGLDGKMYVEVFGRNNYNKTWCYSNLHPIVLGNKCDFGISFYSCLSSDLIALGKPTVEYLDLRELPLYDNDNSLRDDEGYPVFAERYAKLVLSASNYKQFRRCIFDILDDYDNTMSALSNTYKKYYPREDKIINTVSNDIYKRILSAEKKQNTLC